MVDDLPFTKHSGFLYKLQSKVKLIQLQKHFKRYFVLDATSGTLAIKSDPNPLEKEKQTIHFRELIKCVDAEPDPVLDKECKWKHVFTLYTT